MVPRPGGHHLPVPIQHHYCVFSLIEVRRTALFINLIARRPHWMFHRVMQCIVVDTVAVMIVDTLTSMASEAVDLFRRRQRWLGYFGVVGGFFAFYGRNSCPTAEI
jgi:hypothetical protein